MWNDMKDTAKPRSGPVAAPRDGHNISGAAITESEQEPSVDALSDLRHDAFISYSHQDRPFALRLRTALREHGKEVWLDESGIHPAERWKQALKRAIEGSDAFIFRLARVPHGTRSRAQP
jgi:hypothetical protein